MYKLCKTEQSAQRQRELEQGLLAAMSTRQYEEITVSDLCDIMQVPRKSFYRYFSSKDGALHALIDHTLLDCELFPAQREQNGKRESLKVLERFFWFWKEQKPLLDALERSGLSGVLVTRTIDHAMSDTDMKSRFVKQQEAEAREQAITFGICGLMSIVLSWHHEGYQILPEEMARIALRLITRPLFQEMEE